MIEMRCDSVLMKKQHRFLVYIQGQGEANYSIICEGLLLGNDFHFFKDMPVGVEYGIGGNKERLND